MSIENLIYSTTLIVVSIYSLILGFQKGFKKLYYLPLFLLVTVIIDFWLEIQNLISNEIVNNVVRYKFYLIFCINFFAFFYSYVFRKKRRIMLIVFTSLLNMALIFTVDFTNSIFENQLGISLPVFYIFLALMWFQYKLTQNVDEKITDDAYFWISSGLLIWGGFFLFRIIPAKYMFENDPQFHQTLKSMNFIVGTIMYLLFFVALLKFRKKAVLK